MVMSFCTVLFQRGVLDVILNLIETVSEGFPSYSFNQTKEKLYSQSFGGKLRSQISLAASYI